VALLQALTFIKQALAGAPPLVSGRKRSGSPFSPSALILFCDYYTDTTTAMRGGEQRPKHEEEQTSENIRQKKKSIHCFQSLGLQQRMAVKKVSIERITLMNPSVDWFD
jgi:hypothetical protein